MRKTTNLVMKKLSMAIAKKPEKVLIFGIIIFNFVLVFGASAILVLLFPNLSGGSFWKTAYNVFTMILDAGCISSIVNGKYENNIALSLMCIVIIFLGTLLFTGAIIGYLTNSISTFISEANKGNRRLIISDHIVIINWNSRASEIVNDLLYSDNKETVVILVNENREQIENEIKNRIADSIEREKAKLLKQADNLIVQGNLHKRNRHKYVKENYHIKKLTVIVRQGEVYSLKQLNDISVSTAKNIIILGKNESKDICKYNAEDYFDKIEHGNIATIKTLVQISQITSSEESADNQKVVVEVEDDWTMNLVDKIIKHKEKRGKCNIVPIPINKILGQILSQFSIMPELNSVYSELFSNKGSTFYSMETKVKNEVEYFKDYFVNHEEALPITTMNTNTGEELFFIANSYNDFYKKTNVKPNYIDIKISENYTFEKKHIVILGHNSKCVDILEGFTAFISEWNQSDEEIIDILIIDDEEHLKKVNYYKNEDGSEKYPFIKEIVCSEVYDSHIIQSKISDYVSYHKGDTSVLILSDDYVTEDELDSKALTYLVYLQDIVYERIKKDSNFDVNSIDIIIELLNPKNYDVVRSYSVNNVIISNRYISRMVVQIGEKESIYEFYKDILTYDTGDNNDQYESKELYIKDVKRFFAEDTNYPIKTTPRDLVTSVYNESPNNNKSIILGLVKADASKMLFTDSKSNDIIIEKNDKLILFSSH